MRCDDAKEAEKLTATVHELMRFKRRYVDDVARPEFPHLGADERVARSLAADDDVFMSVLLESCRGARWYFKVAHLDRGTGVRRLGLSSPHERVAEDASRLPGDVSFARHAVPTGIALSHESTVHAPRIFDPAPEVPRAFANAARMPRHWLFKTEPETYSWERLRREGRTEWSGVRSFQARNNMIEMRVGDLGFFYHSSTKVPGIAGIVRVVKEAYPDFTARQRGGDYFDPRASDKNPIWQMVDVAYEREMPRFVSLAELRAAPELTYMVLLRKGSRLSVQPVTADQWETILRRAQEPPPADV